ncbi:unnamed protein product [Nippostrongylus brasiliensis]|uniref:CCDC92 domain-containing protein n=1 Tax=Nippostrongylus brasiliensis TaxID=27835 RepID=A0A0N4YG01_NIPBR|nr:unnamed protein product [Nippostrongylus brasiliensis]
MATLLSVVSKFKGRKRGLVDITSPISNDGDVSEDSVVSAVAQLSSDESTPTYIKTILAFLLDSRDKLENLMAENSQLHEEIRRLREENTGLRQKLAVNPSDPVLSSLRKSEAIPSRVYSGSDSVVIDHAVQTDSSLTLDQCDKKEMSRSVIVSGVPEITNCPLSVKDGPCPF